MHDWWFGLVASAFGRVEAIPEQTVLYRQHSNNRLGAVCYNWQYVFRRAWEFLGWDAAAKRLDQTQGQAKALLQRFAETLHSPDRTALLAYVRLSDNGFLERRRQLLKYGFLRTGPLRNLGWLLMV